MTIEGVLYASLPVGLLLSWAVTVILLRGAWRRPRIPALTFMALFSLLISATITVYVWAVANASLDYPVPREVAQASLRALFFAWIVLQVGFLWVYSTRRFRGGAQ